MDSKLKEQSPLKIHLVTSTESTEFTHLTRALSLSTVIGLDAEWKPIRTNQCSSFPTVTLLQIACQLRSRLESDLVDCDEVAEPVVFLLDLVAISPSSVYELLRDVFVSPDILKLGFRFKQDLVYLSSTFCSHVEPYLDISNVYYFLQHKQPGRKIQKEVKSLATICREVLDISLSKELQCSDWSHRPLTEEQKTYAATDAYCLLEIFGVFQAKVAREGNHFKDINGLHTSNLGLKDILVEPDVASGLVSLRMIKAQDIFQATVSSEYSQRIAIGERFLRTSCINTMPMNESLLTIVRKYGEIFFFRESDRKPRTSKRRGKKRSSIAASCREKQLDIAGDWQGPPPWELSLGDDGNPMFLCDVMVEGLAKHLRCVGIDAAIPPSKKPDSRELIDQAYRENRVLLTRDAKLLKHQYVIKNQIYRVKSLLKNEQLNEVIETFHLKISEDQLMSRCTKCNGRFIQKPLTTEEAVEAAKGFQKIPNCLFNKNLEFWQCMDCNQLYWEGTQYHNAVQKFIDVCKLNE
ncbi:exonuclease mut-7 homolog isoform X2 [Tripterygium wilfordii]|uniref:exonuclease mut-7 homolog isoform X2 n=1 Tax=Tripterygium wilfordii TaxID=458696 RepID=UPI0018F82E97|nr:exonuclease mut-7 homolog isoform X2 [Tripterygium wilfordii]